MKIIFVEHKTSKIVKFYQYTSFLINGGILDADGHEYKIIDISVDLFNKYIRVYFTEK
jgi:hypothetical protein